MPVNRLRQGHIHGRKRHPFQTDHPGSSVVGYFSADELLVVREQQQVAIMFSHVCVPAAAFPKLPLHFFEPRLPDRVYQRSAGVCLSFSLFPVYLGLEIKNKKKSYL